MTSMGEATVAWPLPRVDRPTRLRIWQPITLAEVFRSLIVCYSPTSNSASLPGRKVWPASMFTVSPESMAEPADGPGLRA